jgi:uncharacterized protein DUF6484
MGVATAVMQHAAGLTSGITVGRIVSFDSEGRPMVRCGRGVAQPARSLVHVDPVRTSDLDSLPDVAVVFEDGDPSLPVILGLLNDRLSDAILPDVSQSTPGVPETAVVDGKRIVIRAETEIEFICGASSILLRQDGHVVIKGRQVVSRASGANKIRGATVNIN